ncbi:hypothetical protein ES332_D04G109200v1 [Gossypium tomentosum]|uniref:VQ domain-containing protein n=1 Tax=Gossypium tomentosum TaxID=34277 RepID=A0A5D2LC29_GOSTO|nr:hypothetical protein ES332_D04G109200v1 [Gossypium tomentosum]
MENLMIRNQTRMPPSNPSPPLSIHRDSKTISKPKPKPKIRIIHIFAPEIIKTDVANFRELVQRLTGKPPQEKGSKRKPRKDHSFCDKSVSTAAMASKKMEVRSGFVLGLETRERVVKEEEGMLWGNIGDNSSGFLGDLDGFIQQLGEFPLLPLDASNDHMHGFEEVQLA